MHFHNVYFTLKEASAEKIDSLLKDCQQYLSVQDGIVVVLVVVCGRPG